MKVFEFHFNPKRNKERFLKAFTFEPKKENPSRGGLFLLGDLQNALPQHAPFLGNLASTIRETYYGHGENATKPPTPEACLKAALKRANELLAQEVKQGNVQWNGNLHAAILVLAPSTGNSTSVYFTKTGTAEIWLERGGTYTNMGAPLEKNENEPGKVFGAIGAGKVLPGDALFASSPGLFSLLSKEKITQDLAGVREEKLLKKIFGRQERVLSRIAGLLLILGVEGTENEEKKVFQLPSLPLPAWEITPAKKKALVGAGLFILLVLVGILGFQDGPSQEERTLQEAQQQISQLWATAETLRGENPSEASGLLQEALTIAEFFGTPEKEELRETLYAWNQGADTEYKLFLDLSVSLPSFSPTRILATNASLLLYAPGSSSLAVISLDKEGVTLLEAKYPLQEGAVVGGTAVFFTEPNILLSWNGGELKERTLSLPSSGLSIDAMAGYFSGLYVFDNTQGEIYRYATLDSQPQAWTAEDSRKPAEGTASAVIDGNIWTATEQGETMRFWKGKYEETFAFPAYPKDAKIVRLLTKIDTPLLFLIDTKEGRVVVMNKNGELTSQYRSRQLLDAALSPDAKTLFLLQEGNIVTIKIP